MATYIGSATGTTTATLPTHQAGDFIVAEAYRDGNNTAPALPAGQNWGGGFNGGANTTSMRVNAKVATSSAEGVGTFTNASQVIVSVWRPDAGETLSVGASAQGGGSSSTIAWPALTLTNADGSSWVIGFAGHRQGDTGLETPFTGMVNRSNAPNALYESSLHDTNGGVSSWSAGSINVGGTPSGYRTGVLEMIVTGGGGTDGDATGETQTVTASVTGGTATGVRNASQAGATATVTASVTGSSATGVRNVTATGVTLVVGASLAAGSASADQNAAAAGAEVSVSATLLEGSATGAAQAVGAALAATTSITGGLASASGTGAATGALLSMFASFTPGIASAEGVGSAAGANLSVATDIVSGAASAQRNAAQPGALLAVTASLSSGAATGQANASQTGASLSVAASVTGGLATGSAVAQGAALTVSLVSAFGTPAGGSEAAGAFLTAICSVIPGEASSLTIEDTPPERRFALAAQDRSTQLAADDRQTMLAAEDRSDAVGPITTAHALTFQSRRMTLQ